MRHPIPAFYYFSIAGEGEKKNNLICIEITIYTTDSVVYYYKYGDLLFLLADFPKQGKDCLLGSGITQAGEF